MTPFQSAMKFISKWEWMDRPDGAYTNDPKDPGGETKFGISKASHPTLDIKALLLTEAMDCYYKDYWMKYNIDALKYPFSVAVFDSYVQHRPNVVAKLVKDADGDLRLFLELRRIFYLNLIGHDASLLRFKNGWLARLNDLSKYVAILAQEQNQPPSIPLSS